MFCFLFLSCIPRSFNFLSIPAFFILSCKYPRSPADWALPWVGSWTSRRSIRLHGTKTWAARVANMSKQTLSSWIHGFFCLLESIFFAHNKAHSFPNKKYLFSTFWPIYFLHFALSWPSPAFKPVERWGNKVLSNTQPKLGRALFHLFKSDQYQVLVISTHFFIDSKTLCLHFILITVCFNMRVVTSHVWLWLWAEHLY